MSTVADYNIELLQDQIKLRTERLKKVTKDYNKLQNRINAMKDYQVILQKKLDVLQEKAETMACENFADKDELNSIIKKNQKHELANFTN